MSVRTHSQTVQANTEKDKGETKLRVNLLTPGIVSGIAVHYVHTHTAESLVSS